MNKIEEIVTEQAQKAKSREALDLVKNHVIAAMAIGTLPLPLIDIAALTALQLRMIARLSKLYDIPFSQNIAKSVTTSLLGAIIPGAAQRWSWSLLKFIPLIGVALGTITSTTMAGTTTYAVGRAFIRHFEQGKSFLTLRIEDIRQDVQSFMQKAKDVVSAEKAVVEEKLATERRPSARDDLTRIEGIGPKISELLQDRGIATFTQLAEIDVDRLRQILHEANLRRSDPGTWPEQAKLAAAGQWEALDALQKQLTAGRRE
jgi:uncharacterized protein (DUF697 family)